MDLVRTSKFLSYILRHKPESIGLSLDAEGWVDIDQLLLACRQSGRDLSFEQLLDIVENNDKQRFVIREGLIRANQGHSVSISLNLEELSPPDTLYHGTTTKTLDSIKGAGLLKMNRQHVHLSPDINTARKVGRRHGKPVVLAVAAGRMNQEGFSFYLSENGVWLTDAVPWKYLRVENGST